MANCESQPHRDRYGGAHTQYTCRNKRLSHPFSSVSFVRYFRYARMCTYALYFCVSFREKFSLSLTFFFSFRSLHSFRSIDSFVRLFRSFVRLSRLSLNEAFRSFIIHGFPRNWYSHTHDMTPLCITLTMFQPIRQFIRMFVCVYVCTFSCHLPSIAALFGVLFACLFACLPRMAWYCGGAFIRIDMLNEMEILQTIFPKNVGDCHSAVLFC